MLNIFEGKEKKKDKYSLMYEVSSELNINSYINLCKFNINTSMLKIFWYKAKFQEQSNSKFIIFLQYKNSIDNYCTNSCLKLKLLDRLKKSITSCYFCLAKSQGI